MALSEQERIRYAEMIDDYLHIIRFQELGDFEVVTMGLQSISEDKTLETSEKFQDILIEIHDLLHNPELYVALPADYNDFHNILVARINEYCTALQELTIEEQHSRIVKDADFLRKHRDFQHRLRASNPPEVGSSAHTISEDDMLLEQQLHFEE